MPGPRMGPRPADFDEEGIKKSPTFLKWMDVPVGGKLRYACRDFIKGHEDDEERLMRRIMIARRNNVRDHEKLKRARTLASQKQQQQQQQQTTDDSGEPVKTLNADKSTTANAEDGTIDAKKEDLGDKPAAAASLEQESSPTSLMDASSQRKRRYSTVFSDVEVAQEMDISAVEATRSYRAWTELPDGATFTYNQTYIKGTEGHDWMLRKNIWRRMRYRRENKKMMEDVLPEREKRSVPRARVARKTGRATRSKATTTNTEYDGGSSKGMDASVALNHGVSTASQIVDQALLSTTAGVIAGIHHHTTSSSSTTTITNTTIFFPMARNHFIINNITIRTNPRWRVPRLKRQPPFLTIRTLTR